MPTPTNKNRAAWAEEALDAYRAMRGKDEPVTDVKDLINDLLHHARLDLGLSIDECEALSQNAYLSMEEETREDGTEEQIPLKPLPERPKRHQPGTTACNLER